MPDVDGIEATRRISDDPQLEDVRVVMLTTFDLDEHVFEALGSGASGFLVKDTEPVELLRAVRVVAGGEALLTPSVTRRLIAEFASQRPRSGPAKAGLEELTDREREVVGLVALGLSNDEIAETLVISPATAKTHVSRSMTKAGARDRAQLVVLAYQSGLVRPRGVGASVILWATTDRRPAATVRGMKKFRKPLVLIHVIASVGAARRDVLVAAAGARRRHRPGNRPLRLRADQPAVARLRHPAELHRARHRPRAWLRDQVGRPALPLDGGQARAADRRDLQRRADDRADDRAAARRHTAPPGSSCSRWAPAPRCSRPPSR